MSQISSHSGRWLAIALAGPIVQGAILGLRGGPRTMLAFALGLPAIVAAVTLLTTPTLYVGGALFGVRTSLSDVATATARALHALGLAMLGLAPLTLLLATTASLPADIGLFTAPLALLVVVALVIALHRLASEMGDQRGPAWHLLFAANTVVAFIIGARLFVDLVAFGRGLAS